ncbi:DMT family transporter [Neobittarella massiliensis]|uniref:DMT family transporter n=2 Tax=Oscillospiraceae TaxID=216572 RepID=A0A8J6IGI3_9FIRM|nr:DMT family transporter [Neobittarella massiliensis]SCJ77949.1 Uncharacterized protein conserved in bacteria [uncultured Anaerotruncus sp.]
MDFWLLLLAGCFLSLMQSLNGELSGYLGIFEVTFIVHSIGAVLLILYLKLVKRQKIRLRGIPPYLYAAGFLGVALVSTNAYCTPRIGVATAVALSVTGQMVLSAIIDHFGLLGMKKTAFKARRLPAFCLMAAGLVLLVCF